MDHTQAHTYLLNKPFSSVGQPFGPGVDVFKVKDKMFATLAPGKYDEGEIRHWWLNLKCDPDEAHALRDIFDAVIPGYHMNKRLWNTVILDGSVPRGEIERMIDNSFLLVVQKMTKKQREAIMVHL
ncbi:MULTISPECIES: MmcQ/YjbR family DNA-binding protein [unclassified Pseudoalteromonas]|uniref:MmcQ/YjbR family DNA-binding protein n=1 Tax=unclassified Pseudoalteromonas TaxID=194690 RepID=UPI0020974BF6|nr:MmcQ/YjbR family DNA-binding protein [Pseudoalteromonas sp. XMcav2-N]MCO7189767.1 MmcQ/YjbR family DNA-binding protein [Pseudoalteromonas sp. XMcav2-N]